MKQLLHDNKVISPNINKENRFFKRTSKKKIY